MATDIVGSKMSPQNGFGQNGYHGASSDLPGQRTKFNAPFASPDPSTAPGDWETRRINDAQLAPAHGMRSRSHEGGAVPTANSRPASTAAPRGSMKR